MVHWDVGEAVGDFEHHAQTCLLMSSFYVTPSLELKSFVTHLPGAGSYYVRSGQLGAVLSQALVYLASTRRGIFQLWSDKSLIFD